MLSNPTAKSYNNVLNQFATLSGNKAAQSSPRANNNTISTAVAAAGSIIQQNQKQGASFERAVISSYNATKNTAGLAGYGNRIPDILNTQAKIMTEVKSSAYIYLTPQLRDMIQYAKDNGYQFNLVTKDGARISEPLRNAIISIEAGGTIVPYVRSAPVAPIPILLLNPGIVSPNSSIYQNNGNVQQL